MKDIILYTHGGSNNHGCEALIRSTCKVLRQNQIPNKIRLFSGKVQEDELFQIDKICEINSERENDIINNSTIKKQSEQEMIINRYGNLIKNFDKNKIALSIGGDNYCYKSLPEQLAFLNKRAKKEGAKTILWGCSIEPDLLENKEIIEDLKRYDLIIARETITYDALKNAGIENVKLYPDSAFCLDKVELELPKEFIPYNTVGINISPLVQRLESHDNITYNNYICLVQHILDHTNMNVALIPHVNWEKSRDLEPLSMIYEEFKNSRRVCLIGDRFNCSELKGFISRLKIMIAARTHASVAAYSTCVPTLVVGYSVKAIGIAKDIFGTDENYCLPVQSLHNKNQLIDTFQYMNENYEEIKKHLEEVMPKYCEHALNAGQELKVFIEN